MIRIIHLMQRRSAVKPDATLREVAHKILCILGFRDFP